MKSTDNTIEARCILGIRIRALREEQNLTQQQLALMVGRDRSFISRVERGQCSATADTLFILASGLGITPSQLLEGIALTTDGQDQPERVGLAGPGRPAINYELTHL